ncbi:MAG: Spi family protease inhibitor, partial [bacterium]|nr:Spi family protease inhibitor [bacterium]
MMTSSQRRISWKNRLHHWCESRIRAARGRGGILKRFSPGLLFLDHRLKVAIGAIFLLACLVLPVRTIFAADTTVELARSVAEGWLKATRDPLGTPMQRNVLAVSELKNDQGDTVCFMVTLHPTGYMIISPDDEIEPVIAFSPQGRYDASLDNPLRRLLEEDLPGRHGNLKNVRKLNDFVLKKTGMNIKFTSERAKLRSRASKRWGDLAEIGEAESFSESSGGSGLFEVSDDRVSPLVESRWSQGTVAGEAVFNYYT